MTKTAIFVSAFLAILLLTVTVRAQQTQELYQRALLQEHAAGHLEDAISLYMQAARTVGVDRALAARALFRAAACHEKLGHPTDAANLYGEVLRAYPEQRNEVGLAQERLAVLRRLSSAGVTDTPVTGQGDAAISTARLFERYC